MAAEQAAAARGFTIGIRLATEALKLDLRQQAIQAGLGRRVASAWRSKVYPTPGASLGAAGVVFSRASHIIEGHEGALIRSADGFYLAIPTDAAPKKVLGKRVTPGSLERAWGIRLRMVPGGGRGGRSGRPALLVADLRQRRGKRGGFATPSISARRPQKLVTVPLFILLPQVRLKRRLDTEAVFTRAANGLAQTVAAAVERELRNGEQN